VTQSAEQAYHKVLAHVGATLPERDAIDVRVIGEVRTGAARYGGAWGAGSGIIDSQHDVGGWVELKTYDIQRDDDHDGMADTWELANGLDPHNPADCNGDLDGAGFTNLEKYLNSLTY